MADDNDTSVKPDGEHKPAAVTERYTPEASEPGLRREAGDRRHSWRRIRPARRRAFAPPPLRRRPDYVPRPPVRRDQRPPALPPGEKIDDFEIVRLLGRGAFGHVYLARQLSLDRLKSRSRCRPTAAAKAARWPGSSTPTSSRSIPRRSTRRPTSGCSACNLVPGVGLEKIISSLGMQLEVERSLADTLAASRVGPRDLARQRRAGGHRRQRLAPHRARSRRAPRPRGPGRDGRRRDDRLDGRPARPKRSISPTSAACCTATSSRPTSW